MILGEDERVIKLLQEKAEEICEEIKEEYKDERWFSAKISGEGLDESISNVLWDEIGNTLQEFVCIYCAEHDIEIIDDQGGPL